MEERGTRICLCAIFFLFINFIHPLFELQLNEKQLELVGSEKQLKLDSW
jgi:hypothetical protein